MRNRHLLAAALAALTSVAVPAIVRAAPDVAPPADEGDAGPQFPPQFFRPGPNRAGDGRSSPHGPLFTQPMPGSPVADQPDQGQAGSAYESPGSSGRAASGEAAPDAAPKPPTRAETLDKLLGRLAKADDPGEARGIAELVERLWMRSGSDTADLLMERAVAAMNHDRHDVAAALLDQIVALQPGWAEAWNKRATLRFLDNDDAGSMEDISHVLALEPRHFGALSGMGFILQRHGEDKAALTALRRALALYPENEDVRKAVDRLAPAVDGQEL